MAPAQARAVRDDVGSVLLYTPVVARHDFDVAISYLVRRLEENAASQNFLHALFADEAAMDAQEAAFRDAYRDRFEPSTEPRRVARPALDLSDAFANTPDTDPAAALARAWARGIVDREIEVPPGAVTVSTVDDVDEVVARVVAAAPGWAAVSPADRAKALHRVAESLEEARSDLVAAMVHEAGKTVAEADPEVSEAVDFARYYAESAAALADVPGAVHTPVGISVVTPPWNFPVAIPVGSVLASLAAGSAVLVKPAPQTPLCGQVAMAAIQRGLDAPGALTVVLGPEGRVGQHLVTHPSVSRVLLTGSIETARLFAGWRPSLDVLAETSGKNALVITPSADVDLAVADLVRSAFGHAGQKCSAASLAILVGTAGRSDRLRRQLADAVSSLRVGPSTDLGNAIGPLTEPASGKLLRALTTLDEGESWLITPRRLDDEGRLWSPGVKFGVQRGSWFHTTECFGPVLGIMFVETLDAAIEAQNATAFGLTGGLHSLEEAEIARWLDRVEVGNAYVNRHITGAIVRRQPFGGWKSSTVGPGAKAGGPHYVAQIGSWSDSADVPSLRRRVARLGVRRRRPGVGLPACRRARRLRPARRGEHPALPPGPDADDPGGLRRATGPRRTRPARRVHGGRARGRELAGDGVAREVRRPRPGRLGHGPHPRGRQRPRTSRSGGHPAGRGDGAGRPCRRQRGARTAQCGARTGRQPHPAPLRPRATGRRRLSRAQLGDYVEERMTSSGAKISGSDGGAPLSWASSRAPAARAIATTGWTTLVSGGTVEAATPRLS